MGKLVEAVDLPLEEVSADIRGMLRAYQEHRNVMLSDVEIRNKKNQVVGFASQQKIAESELAELERPYRERMDDLERGISHLGIETFTRSFQHAGVIVRFRKGSQRVSWKGTLLNNLLDELREEGELVMAERVGFARNVTPIAPTIKIEK